ncbi:MAG TPA: radical SAM protein, partial [Bdellovibrio sp.]|nr:radical SAM protein [Bdellovibrio sp.]
MLLRRHKDIIAVKGGPNHHPVAFHARNFEIAQISEEAWTAMAPTTFNNSFPMSLEESEVSSEADAFTALESWNQEINADFKLSQLKFGIKSLTINITQICNLHCVYCAAGGDGTYGDPIAKISVEKVLPQIKFFLDKLNQGDVFHVTFLGGEPLLYPQAIKLIADYVNSTALEKGLRSNFTVITNGTLISDDNLKLLSSIKASITVSI